LASAPATEAHHRAEGVLGPSPPRSLRALLAVCISLVALLSIAVAVIVHRHSLPLPIEPDSHAHASVVPDSVQPPATIGRAAQPSSSSRAKRSGPSSKVNAEPGPASSAISGSPLTIPNAPRPTSKVSPAPVATSSEGDWQGTLVARNGNLPLIFHLSAGGSGTVDSPAQRFSAPLQYTANGNQVTIRVASINATFGAIVNGNQMSGTWSQDGRNATLTVTKAGAPGPNGGGGGQPLPLPDHDYPLTLTVNSARRFNGGGGITTEIIGSLSDDPDHKQLHMTCDLALFSIGPDGKYGNTYPVRHDNKKNEIKIQTREQGSDKFQEHTCKF
jgi:hypothetical protein